MPIDGYIQSKKFRPVGFCIYCGANDGPFTDEHIIPYGLLGRFVLQSASCKGCERLTGKVEEDNLRFLLGNFRYRTGAFPARKGKGKDRRKTFKIERVDANGTVTFEDAPLSEFPLVLHFPVYFGPPSIFGASAEPEMVWYWYDEDDFKEFQTRQKHGGRAILASWDTAVFFRMIAKIALAWTYASMEADVVAQYEMRLNNFIRVGAGDAFELVGTIRQNEPPSQFMNDIRLTAMRRGSREYLICFVRIFGALSSPTYAAVVGDRAITHSTPLPEVSLREVQ